MTPEEFKSLQDKVKEGVKHSMTQEDLNAEPETFCSGCNRSSLKLKTLEAGKSCCPDANYEYVKLEVYRAKDAAGEAELAECRNTIEMYEAGLGKMQKELAAKDRKIKAHVDNGMSLFDQLAAKDAEIQALRGTYDSNDRDIWKQHLPHVFQTVVALEKELTALKKAVAWSDEELSRLKSGKESQLVEELAAIKAENEKLENERNRRVMAEEFKDDTGHWVSFKKMGYLKKENERLSAIIDVTETPEWKSAAYQKIKKLKAQLKAAAPLICDCCKKEVTYFICFDCYRKEWPVAPTDEELEKIAEDIAYRCFPVANATSRRIFLEIVEALKRAGSGKKPKWYYEGNGTTYSPETDAEASCWSCKKTFLCDPMDATCRLCGAPFDESRCKEFGFKPLTPKPE